MVDYKESELEQKVYEFIQEVFLGIETKVFGMISGEDSKDLSTEMQNSNNSDLNDLKTQKAMLYGANLLEFYLNELYKNLVDKSDDFIYKKFEDLGQLVEIHPVYVLNVITNVIMKAYPLCPRSKLVIESKEKYIDSVKEIVLVMKKYMMTLFNEDLKVLNAEREKNSEKNN